MKPSELIKLLEPFCKADLGEEPAVMVAVDPSKSLNGILPMAPDTVRIWEINKTAFVLIFRDPNK